MLRCLPFGAGQVMYSEFLELFAEKSNAAAVNKVDEGRAAGHKSKIMIEMG